MGTLWGPGIFGARQTKFKCCNPSNNNNNNNTITTATGEHENMLKWRGEHEKNCVSESGKLAEHIKEKPSKMNFSYTQHPFAVANGVY